MILRHLTNLSQLNAEAMRTLLAGFQVSLAAKKNIVK